MTSREIREKFLSFFATKGHTRRGQLIAGARRRPDPAVHQRRHGAVQEGLPGRRDPALHPGRQLPEVRPGRRQAQRPGKRRPHRPAPYLLRDAGQLLLRRLFQGRGHRDGLGTSDRALQASPRSDSGPRSITTTTRPASSGRRSPAFPGSGSSGWGRRTISGPWAIPAPAAPAPRSLSTRAKPWPAARTAASAVRLRPLPGDLEPRLHAVQPGRRTAS